VFWPELARCCREPAFSGHLTPVSRQLSAVFSPDSRLCGARVLLCLKSLLWLLHHHTAAPRTRAVRVIMALPERLACQVPQCDCLHFVLDESHARAPGENAFVSTLPFQKGSCKLTFPAVHYVPPFLYSAFNGRRRPRNRPISSEAWWYTWRELSCILHRAYSTAVGC
jgi:hypothetical protein